MRTTNGYLTYLLERLSAIGVAAVILFAVALVVALGLAALTVGELFAATSEPVQVAPLRWLRRF